MSHLVISKKNEIYLTVKSEAHVYYELSDYFTFEVPGAKFMPSYKNKYWDGRIRLFNPQRGEIYVGLLDRVVQFCNDHEYTYQFVNNEYYGLPFEVNEFISLEGVKDYMTAISKYKPRDYQIDGVYDALKHNRRLIISPTASGKSLMIYSIVRYFVEQKKNILIVVPTTSLVEQMYKDFESYGWKASSYCHRIYAGQEKYTNHQVVITTWQSIYKEPKKWFDRFDCVIGDEAHLFKAKSLSTLMGKLHDCKYRIGFTGTLDGANVNQLVLEGLFGRCSQVTSTNKLMKKGYVAKLKVKVLLLKHEEKLFEGYQDEIEYLVEHSGRNNYIKNLAIDLKGNTLILFNYVDKHGIPLFNLINSNTERPMYLVHGGVDTDDREDIRHLTETSDNAIIVASYGTFSTGINIKNLHNVIFASPSKSRIRNLQSIGRVLRKGDNKSKATLYDIADDVSTDRGNNYTLNHLMERVKIYNEEKFQYEIIDVKVKTYD